MRSPVKEVDRQWLEDLLDSLKDGEIDECIEIVEAAVKMFDREDEAGHIYDFGQKEPFLCD